MGGVRKAISRNLITTYNIRYSKHKVGEEALYSFWLLYSASSISFLDKPLYYYSQRTDSLSHTSDEDPYESVVESLIESLESSGVYDEYANTVNAFMLTAAAVSLYRMALYNNLQEFIPKAVARRKSAYTKIDYNHSVDYRHMTYKSMGIVFLMKMRLYPLIWLLCRMRG